MNEAIVYLADAINGGLWAIAYGLFFGLFFNGVVR